MDWDKKVYPKDVWNWFKSLLPNFKIKLPKMPKNQKKFVRETKFTAPRSSFTTAPSSSIRRSSPSIVSNRNVRSVREFVNNIERKFTKSENDYFDTSMKKLDDFEFDFDNFFDVWDTRK